MRIDEHIEINRKCYAENKLLFKALNIEVVGNYIKCDLMERLRLQKMKVKPIYFVIVSWALINYLAEHKKEIRDKEIKDERA